MNYQQAIEWINSFDRNQVKLGLDRIKNLCDRFNNPQIKYDTVHVAGTNGKGSVCRIVAEILKQAGHKTGLYTSPHLNSYKERFMVDGREITKDELVEIIKLIKPVVNDLDEELKPTYFEISTLIAFLFFNMKKVDIAVIEVGLGGRFDATNIVEPLVTVITNISLEHQRFLGEKIEEIAYEKAGIIKEKIPLVTAANNNALEKIKEIAGEKHTKTYLVDKDKYTLQHHRINDQGFIVHGMKGDYSVDTRLNGSFQGENIALSVYVAELLQDKGYLITDKHIKQGITNVENPGRIEIIQNKPYIILDGAHNPDGIEKLSLFLKNEIKYDKLIVILGILSDKNIKEMIKNILPIVDILIITKSRNTRACEPNEILSLIDKKDLVDKIIQTEKIDEAVKKAQELADKKDLICITGSLFTVAEARRILIS